MKRDWRLMQDGRKDDSFFRGPVVEPKVCTDVLENFEASIKKGKEKKKSARRRSKAKKKVEKKVEKAKMISQMLAAVEPKAKSAPVKKDTKGAKKDPKGRKAK